MPYSDAEIKALVANFDLTKAIQKEEILEPERKRFVADYPIERIKTLTKEEYVCGRKKAGYKDYRTFCYRIEVELEKLGNMQGNTAKKFGIYLSDKTGQYEMSSKFGSEPDEVFSNVRDSIVSLLDAARAENFKAIEENRLPNIFKYKIIATYYPNRYLPVFNEKHIETFLSDLGIQYSKKETFLDKEEKLRLYKENNPAMKDWSLFVFVRFLYQYFADQKLKTGYVPNKQKQDDEAYPAKYKSGIAITKGQWLEMLKDKSIFFDDNIDFLCRLYKENNHAATCSELALKKGDPPKTYNSPMVALAKRVLSHLGRQPEKNEKGEKRFWNVLFWGRNLPGHYEWKLRPELADALYTLYPDLGGEEVNDDLDSELTKDISTKSFREAPKEIKDIKRDKPEPTVIRGVLAYPRNRSYASLALMKANHKCEVDNNHSTFARKADGLPYTEPHHLIPMSMQGRYNVSIDVPENIVSLCSNCHNEIHYGAYAEKLLTRLYGERKEKLQEAGITVTLEELLGYYK